MDSSKEDKLIVRKFNYKAIESFHLWKLTMETRNCLGVVEGTKIRPETNTDPANTQKHFDKKTKKAAAIIITALGDKPLKALQKHSKSPLEMWEKLCARYASKTTSNKLSLITEAFGKKKKKSETMMDHIAELETTFAKLDNVGQPLNELIRAAILLSSIKLDRNYESVIAAIRTIDEEKTNCEAMTTRLVDEYKEKISLQGNGNGPADSEENMRAAIMQGRFMKKCNFCKRKGHLATKCWKNPDSSSYKPHYKNERHTQKHKPRLAVVRHTKQERSQAVCTGLKEGLNDISSAIGTQKRLYLSALLKGMSKATLPYEATCKVAIPSLCSETNQDDGKGTAVRTSDFIIDMGATHHMSAERNIFHGLHSVDDYSVIL